MKKRVITLLICFITLIGLVGCRQNTNTPSTNLESPTPSKDEAESNVDKNIPDLNEKDYQVYFESLIDSDSSTEYATIDCRLDDELLWSYTTESFPLTELLAVEFIAQLSDRVYVNEGGTITAIDITTGQILWRNAEFGGQSILYALDGEERLFLCGYYGPHFFELDTSGKTINKIDTFNDDYIWPEELTYSDNMVRLLLNYEEDLVTLNINLEDYSYTEE